MFNQLQIERLGFHVCEVEEYLKKKADGYVAHLLTNIVHLFYKAFPLLPQTFVFF